MNTDHTQSWPRDFETNLPLIPYGQVGDFAPYAKTSTQPAAVRKLPVLSATFDASRFDRSPGLPAYAGYGSIQLGNTIALTFRIQRGPDMVYWLANPADQEVWAVVDQWAKARRMVLAADFSDGQCVLLSRDFHEAPPMRQLRRSSQPTQQFVADVSRAIVTNEMQEIATTDLPQFPKLRHVQACILKTSTTGSVALALEHVEQPDTNPFSAAIRELAEGMTGRGSTRH